MTAISSTGVSRAPLWLPLVSLIGFVAPNGLFIYWLVAEFPGIAAVMHDKLALAFIIDVFLALVLLSIYFARYPIGPVRWHWFVVLSFAGGLAFSLPFYYWLNLRRTSVRGG